MTGASVLAKRANMAQMRAVLARRPCRYVLLSVAAAVLFAAYHSRNSFPLLLSLSQSPATTKDWRFCNRDAACCKRLLSPSRRAHRVVNATLALPRSSGGDRIRWRMATHPNSDVVSTRIQHSGAWDPRKSLEILNALRAAPERGLLFDVGANIGWFTLAMAHAGHNVIAFEPFRENLALQRHSLCLAPPEVRARVQLLPFALGERDGMKCALWQIPSHNRGDTFTVCSGSRNAPESASMREKGFKKLGEAHVRRLDSMIANGEVVFPKDRRIVMKIDIEGFEPLAFRGAKRFLKTFWPNVIFSEYVPRMIKAAAQSVGVSVQESNNRPKEFIAFMNKARYSNAMYETGVYKHWGATFEAVFIRKQS